MTCECAKRIYRKDRARQIAAQLNHRDAHLPGTWNAYKCPFERLSWHLGHIPERIPTTRQGQRELVRHATHRRPHGPNEAEPQP